MLGATAIYIWANPRWGVPHDVTGVAVYVDQEGVNVSFRPDNWPGPGPERGAPVMGLHLDPVGWVDHDGHLHTTGRPACMTKAGESKHVALTLVAIRGSAEPTNLITHVRCLD